MEAYANEFLVATCVRADAAAVDRLPTPEKLILAPRLNGLPTVVQRGREPHQTISRLFKVRNLLVHPSAQGYSALVIDDLTDRDEADLGPTAAGDYLIAVGHMIFELNTIRSDRRWIGEAALLWEEAPAVRGFVAAMGPRIGDIPAEDAGEPVGLLHAAREHRAERLARERSAATLPADRGPS